MIVHREAVNGIFLKKSNFSLIYKFFIGSILIVSLIGTISFFYYESIQNYIKSTHEIQTSQKILHQLEIIFSYLKDEETAQRGFYITHDEQYLEPYYTASRLLPQELDSLYSLYKKNGVSSRYLGTLKTHIHRNSELTRYNINLVREGKYRQADKMFKSDDGKKIMDQLRRIIRKMEEEESIRFNKLSKRAGETSQNTFYIVSGSVVFIAILLLIGVMKVVIDLGNRQKLQESLQELNKEISTVNEELVSNNEELNCTLEELRSINEKLEESETKFRSFVEKSSDLIFNFDQSGKLVYTNPALVSTLGYSPEELTRINVIDIIDPVYHKLAKFSIFRNVLKEESSLVCEYPVLTKDGNTIWLSMNIKLEVLKGGDFNQVLVMARDVTARKYYELELIKAREIAYQSLKMKQSFLSVMSHEIRTPLNAIVGMTKLLMMENPRKDQLEYLSTLKFSSDTLLVVINDILDFSKIEAGKAELEAIDFNLKELIQGIIQSFCFKADEKKIKLESEIEPDIPEVLTGDPTRVNQILNNLMSNALKFTERGQVVLKVKLQHQSRKSVDLLFEVHDTGIGIPEEKHELIFESFSQANAETTRKFGGTGLGLAICKSLVELQGGLLKVNSIPGEGSVFYFNLTLGIGEEALLQPTETILAENTNLRNVKLLLVEDNFVNMYVAKKFLKRWGIEPDTASNGAESIAKVKKNKYDIVLMDLQMPEMDGYTACREIRKIEGASFVQLPIIALTASVYSDVKERGLSAGLNDFITKPFNPEDLYEKIAKYVNNDLSDSLYQETDVSDQDQLNFEYLIFLSEGSDKTFKDLLHIYIDQLDEISNDVRQALAAKTVIKLRFAIHKYHSTISILGLKKLEKQLLLAKKLLNKRLYGQSEELAIEIAETCKAYQNTLHLKIKESFPNAI